MAVALPACIGVCALVGVRLVSTALAAQMNESQPLELAKAAATVRELRALVPRSDRYYSISLQGTVLWINAAQGRVVLQDGTGLAELEFAMPQVNLQVGHRVRLSGNCTVVKRAGRTVLLPKGPLIDNDGVHVAFERVGAVYLDSGLHPFCLTWFNGPDQLELAIEIEGPHMPRQPIPSRMLFRGAGAAGADASALEPGLDYECVDAFDEILPDFDSLRPVCTGYTDAIDLRILPRTNRIAVRFTGYLRVPEPGLYRFYLRSDDGSQLFVGAPPVKVTVLGTNALPAPRKILPGQFLAADEEIFWAETEGRVTLVRPGSTGAQLELSAGAARVELELAERAVPATDQLMGRRIRAVGVCLSAVTTDGQRVPAKLLIAGTNQLAFLPSAQRERVDERDRSTEFPTLTTAVAVHKLKREEAQRGYPVRLVGVVTCVLPEHQAFTMQDSTRGIYVVDMTSAGHGPPSVGEYVQVEGVTDPGLFAPVVNATRIVSDGLGQLPEPVQPTFDQLLSGSMDAQYVQIQGIVTDARSNTVVLHMRDGCIQVQLRPNNIAPSALPTLRDALVRIRGCLFASWDYVTHQVKPGEIRVYNADIFVDEPAPPDIFATPTKKVAELLQFDPLAGAFQRVKVEGQIVGRAGTVFFMMQDTLGMRFICRTNIELDPGDMVEVVGFPDVVAACSPTLREAVVRKTGHGMLPEPRKLGLGELYAPGNDATRVHIEATLIGMSSGAAGQALELQMGMRTFIARPVQGVVLPRNLARGSRLELTGVYVGHGSGALPSQRVSSFELLVTAPEDIRILARPPWWTFGRLLVVIGVLLGGLCMAGLWITLLHRKVEQRTAELTAQIQQRQRAEHRQWLERERTRIAQDLHDELGSGITEISMLALRASTPDAPAEKRLLHLEQIRSRATELVTALDEIVWATNPKHDSLASLISYFSLYADRFLGAANIRCRVEPAPELTDRPVPAHTRHELFMVFREALNNVVKHAKATEVRIAFGVADAQLEVSVADNGQGMDAAGTVAGGEGLASMRTRIERLGGTLDIRSGLGQGTRLKFVVPLGSVDV